VVAWRGNRRWSRSHIQMAAGQIEATQFRDGGVYLLTGGLGDLALTFAQQLASARKAKIALFARSALPAREHWSALLRILPAQDRRRTAITAIEAMEKA